MDAGWSKKKGLAEILQALESVVVAGAGFEPSMWAMVVKSSTSRQSPILFDADQPQRLQSQRAQLPTAQTLTQRELAVLLRRRGAIGPSCDLPSVGRVAPTPYAEYAQRLCQNLAASGPLCETVRCRTRFKFGPPAPARRDRRDRTDRYLCPALDLTPQPSSIWLPPARSRRRRSARRR